MHGPIERCGHATSKVAINDLPWLLSLANERYRRFDPGRTLMWLVDTIKNEYMLASRTTDAFCITSMLTPAWHPKEPEAHVLFLCAAEGAHWQAMSLLRESVAWARGKGCVRYWLSSETEHSIEALAKRVGAEPAVTRYKLDLASHG